MIPKIKINNKTKDWRMIKLNKSLKRKKIRISLKTERKKPKNDIIYLLKLKRNTYF